MNIAPPKLPKDVTPVDSFAVYARQYLQDDRTITGIRCGGEQAEAEDFYKIDLRESVFENCVFHKCGFEKAGFVDVLFQSCDFSNSNFQGAYFERCQFVSCKCVGADLIGASLKQTTFADSNLQYANFNTAKLTAVRFDHVDFSDASMAEAKLKRFAASDTKFIRNDFSKTPLAGVDFTASTLLSPVFSSPSAEVRGMVVDLFQAADLARLLGVRVKQP